ncbi:MAG: hypothetical protein JXN62_11550 [Bacteroidales bacterium]|nr:hypothetical protein [Bacteroidales bacterium]
MRETYGEYLFDAVTGSITECLAGITEEDVRDCCDFKVYRRGQEYYEEGMVEELVHNKANNTVIATVNGTREYQIEFSLEEGGIYSTCDCPYDGVCKHTVAVLLNFIHQGTDNIATYTLNCPTTAESLDFLKKYLETLSKKDLVLLAMKFAPANFIKQVQNLEMPENEAEAIFKKAEKKIRKFFEDPDLLYDPGGMESALISQLDNLKGLENQLSDGIGELLLYIIRSIETAFNEGYLYIDDYSGDEYFESDDFCEYVIAYVKQLPFEIKTKYLKELDQALNEMSYDTFSTIQESYHRFFSEHERAELKSFINSEAGLPVTLISRLYKFMEPELATDEKEALLRLISRSEADHFLSFCMQLSEQNRLQEVIDLIKDDSEGFNPLTDSRISEIYLDAVFKLNMNFDKVCEEVATHCPEISILQKIKSLKGTVASACEKIVKQRNPEDLLIFYEKENRMKDALALVREPGLFYEDVAFGFFKKNHKHFPAETEAFLKGRIEENLKHTGKINYERIAESLDLMKRINPGRSGRIAEEIRANFKRRSSLIQIIRGF